MSRKPQNQNLRNSTGAATTHIDSHPSEVQTVTLHGDYIELDHLLKLAGLCDSGGAGKALVASGQVQVDGQRELRKTCKLRAGQTVFARGVRIVIVAAHEAV